MKIEIISAFCAVADTKSFSHAAESLYVTQPTISKYIAQLEQELECQLFDRSSGAIELTDFGCKIYVYAKRMLDEWEHIRNEAKNSKLDEFPALRIGYTYDMMLPFITKALSDPSFPFRELDLSLKFGEGGTMTQLLQSNQIDCAVMHLPSLDPSRPLEVRLLRKSNLRLIAPKDHPLAKQREVTIAQLTKETDVRCNRERRYYNALDSAFLKIGLPPMKHIFVQNASDTLPVMQYYNKVCLSPDIYDFWDGCNAIPISDWSVDYSLVLVMTKECHSKIVDAFFHAIQNHLNNGRKK